MTRKFLNGIDAGSSKIINVANGSGAQDAAAYGQVLAVAPPWIPSDNGYLAATTGIDSLTGSGGFTAVSGSQYLIRLPIRYPVTISNLTVVMNSSGSGITYANMGLINSSGTLVTSGTAVTSGASYNGTFAMGASSSWTPANQPWIALLIAATSPPRLAGSVATLPSYLNFNLSAASYRFAINGTGLSALQSVTLSSNATPGTASLPLVLAS